MTIKEKVKEILERDGRVDNFSMIDQRITTRLSDVIFHLIKDGYVFDDEKSGFLGESKNWCYVLLQKPAPKQLELIPIIHNYPLY